jgi:hypothetical protein
MMVLEKSKDRKDDEERYYGISCEATPFVKGASIQGEIGVVSLCFSRISYLPL